jgi:hypothetical protein
LEQQSQGRTTEIMLERSYFGDKERAIVRWGDLSAHLFRYETGVEAIRVVNPRGYVIVLPYMGQMVWRACFDSVELAMQSMFDAPRPASTIIETYGCVAYHAGLLRNGVPTAEDTHPLHGEAPCGRKSVRRRDGSHVPLPCEFRIRRGGSRGVGRGHQVVARGASRPVGSN